MLILKTHYKPKLKYAYIKNIRKNKYGEKIKEFFVKDGRTFNVRYKNIKSLDKRLESICLAAKKYKKDAGEDFPIFVEIEFLFEDDFSYETIVTIFTNGDRVTINQHFKEIADLHRRENYRNKDFKKIGDDFLKFYDKYLPLQ